MVSFKKPVHLILVCICGTLWINVVSGVNEEDRYRNQFDQNRSSGNEEDRYREKGNEKGDFVNEEDRYRQSQADWEEREDGNEEDRYRKREWDSYDRIAEDRYLRRRIIALTDYKDRSVFLDGQDIRWGTFVFNRDGSCPEKDFFVNFRVRHEEQNRGYYRIYLNLRKLNMDKNEKIVVYGSLYTQQFGQTWTGTGLPQVLDATTPSVAQFYSVGESIRFEYSRGDHCHDTPSELAVDFALVQGDFGSQYRELWCPALNGYVPTNVYCHSKRSSLMICPERYRWSDGMNNPGTIFRQDHMCAEKGAKFPDKDDKPEKDTTDKPDIPDKPEKDTTDKPDIPNKPEKDSTDKPDTPDKPDLPDAPDLPDTPDTPDKPSAPGIPGNKASFFPPNIAHDPRPGHQVNQEDVHWENAMYPFPKKWSPQPFDGKDEQDPRFYSGWLDWFHKHNHPSVRMGVWSVVAIVAGAFILCVLVPIMICVCCFRRRNQVRYERTTLSPTAPLYGTFVPGANDNHGFKYTETTPLAHGGVVPAKVPMVF